MVFNSYSFGTQNAGSATAPVSAVYNSGNSPIVGFVQRVDWDARLNSNVANTTGCVIGSFYLAESGTNTLISAFVASGNHSTNAYPITYNSSNLNLTISGTAGNGTTPFLVMNPLALSASGVGLAGSLANVIVHWNTSV